MSDAGSTITIYDNFNDFWDSITKKKEMTDKTHLTKEKELFGKRGKK